MGVKGCHRMHIEKNAHDNVGIYNIAMSWFLYVLEALCSLNLEWLSVTLENKKFPSICSLQETPQCITMKRKYISQAIRRASKFRCQFFQLQPSLLLLFLQAHCIVIFKQVHLFLAWICKRYDTEAKRNE